ncbi:helix-turn-helix domain-containing protein [Amycolatopsis sp. H20-H5]|uniref:helix-turn-helix domain-containing protein n=1 Tax=Amycolatopsis sp. H20-H5 TaxID=3046309 RepID=UPI002DB75AE6|nr:helix-turn-helix transcriptional regulator [Amycolatopsis sp. H20-H5]MEC3980865.1 helix-turn-helix transcriptional regulator [Amycolatopsis sp. H20-H5]
MPASTRATRYLGAFLRDMRTACKMLTTDVATHLDQSDSTVGRYERGELRLTWPVIGTLVTLYGGNADELAEARRRYDAAKNEPKPVRLPAKTLPAFRRLVNEERVATGVRTVQPIVVPGLLQIEEYTDALGDQLHDPSSRSVGASSVRQSRQQRLDPSEARPLHLHAILDEIVITRRVGGVAVMRKQLLHIIDLMGRDNITVQMVPAEAGAYGLTNGGIFIVDYEEPVEPSGVYFEYPAGNAWVENEKDVQRFAKIFDRAVRVASKPDETADFLHRQMRVLESK